MKLTKEQEDCPYCHGEWFKGSSGWQNAKVFFRISDDGTLETMINGTYGYKKGLKECPFCIRDLENDEKLTINEIEEDMK